MSHPMNMRLTNLRQIYQRVEALHLTHEFGRFEFTRHLTTSRRYSKATIETHSMRSTLSSEDSQLTLKPMSLTALCTAESPRNAKQTQGRRPKVVVNQQGLGPLTKGTSLYLMLS
jgi:hypothetical protein